MRLLKFLQYSGIDEDTNKFRALNIKLLDRHTNYNNTVKKTEKKYNLDRSILESIDNLNRELKKIYNGKWLFQLCLDEGKSPNEIIRSNKREKLQRLFLQINEEFSNIKFDIERKISNN